MKTFFFRSVIIHQLLYPVLANDSNKIVGGEETVKGRYPYQVAFVSGNFQYCGGSLVDEYWVLSAAHCKTRFGQTNNVRIGSYNLATDDPDDFETIEIDWETQHPDYYESSLENDFMMVKLKEPSAYATVTLDDGSDTLETGTDVTVMGWGTTSSGGYSSNILMEVEVDIVENSACNAMYGQGRIRDSMMCAGRAGKDSCQGDSGGPLILKGGDASQDVLVGVVSWGYGCAHPRYPGVYARITAQSNWIAEQIISGTRPENDNNGSWGNGSGEGDYDADVGFSEVASVFLEIITGVLRTLMSLMGGGGGAGEERL